MGINLSSCGAVIADASLLRPIPSPESGHFPVRRGDGGAELVLPPAGRIFLRQDLRIFVLFLSLFLAFDSLGCQRPLHPPSRVPPVGRAGKIPPDSGLVQKGEKD